MLRDPAERIKNMEEALQSIKDAKQEGANSVIQEMTLDEKKEWKSFPCDYDYVVEFNQTKIVLKIIKQMYAEIYKEFYNQIQSIRNCEHGEFDISPDLAVTAKPKNDKITKTKATNKIIKGKKVQAQYQSPPPMKPIEFREDPIQKESEVENIEKPQNVKQTFSKEEIEKDILSIFGEEDTKQTQPDNQSDLSKDLTSLILDMKLVFQFLQNDKKCKNTKIATIQGNKRITHKQVLEFISSYVQDLEKGQQLTIQQITSFEKIYTLKNVQNFIGYLKQNQLLDLSSLSSKLQILK